MTPSTLPNGMTVHYQVPRDILVRILWLRMLLRPRRLASLALLALTAMLIRFGKPGSDLFVFTFVGAVAIFIPINLYRMIAKAVDDNAQLTDPKTVEFNASRLVVTGPNWRSELPWTTFHGFSEDDSYFYLHLSSNGFASVVPKATFTPEQKEAFREYAKTRNGYAIQRPDPAVAE